MLFDATVQVWYLEVLGRMVIVVCMVGVGCGSGEGWHAEEEEAEEASLQQQGKSICGCLHRWRYSMDGKRGSLCMLHRTAFLCVIKRGCKVCWLLWEKAAPGSA